MSRTIVPSSLDRWRPIKVASSVAVLVVLVVAVPIILVVVGGVPFSHAGMAQISGSLTSTHAADPRLVTEWIAGSVLVLAWLAWSWMTVCVGVELRAWVTGRTPVRLPASRTVQSVAACLVGTALAMSTVGRAMPTPRQRTATGLTAVPLRPTGSTEPSGSANLTDLTEGTEVDVVPIARLLQATSARQSARQESRTSASSEVRPSTSSPVGVLISETEHGEIPTASTPNIEVNRRQDAQREPDHPASTEAPHLTDPLAAPKTHLVRPRETLWSIAEDELGSALRWHELAECNYGVTQPDGRSLDEDHWVVPGWRLLLPPAAGPDRAPRAVDTVAPIRPAPAPAPAQEAAPPTASVMPATDSAIPDHPDRRDVAQSRSLAPPTPPTPPAPPAPPTPPTPMTPTTPVVPLGGGVVGAGVVRLLDRLRQVQQRHRAEGGYIRLPDSNRSRFEQRLRVGDGRTITHEVDAAIRRGAESATDAMAHALPPSTSAPVPSASVSQVLGVRIHPEVIELVLAEEGRRVVVVERSTLPPEGDVLPDAVGSSIADRRAAAPMLVTVGQGAVGSVMVNLESLGSLLVSGHPDEADAVVRALALELATSHWAGQFSVAVVGFGSELDRFEGVTSHGEIDELARSLYRRKIDGTERLRATGYPSFATARRADPSDRWAPLVVICGPAVRENDVAELVDIGSDPVLGMAVVAVGERAETQYSVRLTGDTWAASLELLGAVVFPQRIGSPEWGEVTALVDTAAIRESVLSSEEPYVNLPIRLPHPIGDGVMRPAAARPAAEPAAAEPAGGRPRTDTDDDSDNDNDNHPDILVAVLGPIEIRGAARPFARAWAEELVVYLAMHPKGASNEGWATALWPDRLMAPSSLHSTASVARRSLGQGAHGGDHLPRSHGRLALAETVGTDWDHFVALAGSDRPEHWHQALELVRGRPFEGLRSSDWPILEGIAPAIEAAVVDLSGRLAGTYLRLGNAQGAEWAARRGLVVSPYDERLYRMLMRAADAGGNPAGVDAVMAELLRLVADDIEPLDAVHPSTMDLYRQLSRRRKFSSPRP